jgi:hypothetical protein
VITPPLHLRHRIAVLATLLLALPAAASAQRAGDTVFIVPGGHFDLGFTAPIGEIGAQRIQNLDHAIELASRDPSFVWFEEGGWSVETWLDRYHNDPMRIGRLRTLVQRGQIGVGATLLSPYAAAFPGSLRLLTLHLDRIQRELGRRPTVAVINDVPAVPEALVDALAAAGIKYLLLGPNLIFSSPLPANVTTDPFYWESARGARVLVSIDPAGYGAGLSRWLLPPDCIRAYDPREFPAAMSDDSILNLGVRQQLAHRTTIEPLSIIQHAIDNGGPECVTNLDAAARRWNMRRNVTKLVPSIPDVYFQHLEARRGTTLRVLHGEWGGDWDMLRASEPVWSWRLRQAMRAITPTSPRTLSLAAVMATDHNVGLGPRWQDGLPVAEARQHITDVAELYRSVVGTALGAAALASLPAPLVAPPAGPWPAAWRQIIGERSGAARVRAGAAFLYPFVNDTAPDAAVPITVTADEHRLLIHTGIDRVALERRLGPRYQAVIEVTLHAPIGAVTLAPDSSASALAGHWLLGTPTQPVVAPEGVRVSGPGWSFTAHGPLLISWTLRRDPHNPAFTRLQALAIVHAVEGTVTGGQKLRLPFAEMYPGEPATPVFDLELRLRASK